MDNGVVMRAADIGGSGSGSGVGRYLGWLERERGLVFGGYDALWRWSVAEPEAFWASIWDHYGVRARRGYERVLGSVEMPGARWFAGAELNYAEHMVGDLDTNSDSDALAITARSQSRGPVELTYGELRERVARARAGLHELGVRAGDRVVAYLPNVPETLVAFLAAASLGAVWASCAPEFGARSVVDRLAQVEPTVLLAVSGYTYGRTYHDRRDEVSAIRAGLPTLRHVVEVPYGEHPLPETMAWDELLAAEGPLEFDPVGFDHPLYVLFSSGTTGLPKVIVHGHGGILLEHLKLHGLHLDTRPGDRALWFTTTAWAMWNITISAMLHRAALVLLDGNPLAPDLGAQWRLGAETGATLFGTSPGYLMACRKAGLAPPRWPELRSIGTTGSPLPAEGFDWVYQRFGGDVLLNPISGGTDVCSAFVGGGPWQPVYRGEMSGPCLGVDVTAFDPAGNEVVGELGELVIRAPMPSMPPRFWNDPGDARYRSSYFDAYPGVWRHGDWTVVSPRRSFVITGRSDATLNRGGVRLGTAEFYAVVEELPEIADSLVVHLENGRDGQGELALFVQLTPGTELDDALRGRIKDALRGQLSPRHVPDSVHAVPVIPRTLTGKKLEQPIKRILQGAAAREVLSPEAMNDPSALDAFTELAARR
ncbi:acetoacetate--CoA ligase [Pseudonocardia acaciae]|uniref:acetoacetate--CoA ligase n=1 Tax=Pseudonocardia acaciae TaxID=551276 RepID=UPI0006852EC5|nr:acetoacetate--CoA ligase [Pseudonocardia acaciae]